MAAVAKYRPQASGDGVGGIDLTEEQLQDREKLAKEAAEYARRFVAEEDTGSFRIGVSNYTTNRAFLYTIEAARLLCAGSSSTPYALKLLQMAAKEVETESKGKVLRFL
jgi:hypothetical protein